MRDEEADVVEEHSKTVPGAMCPDQFELLETEKQQCRERMWEAIERIGERNADKDPDEVLADVTAVVAEVRRERNASTS